MRGYALLHSTYDGDLVLVVAGRVVHKARVRGSGQDSQAMATAPTWGDPRILRQIKREGRRIGDPRVRRLFELAAVQTGIVESGGRNLPGGDADSAGWRQERASLYPNPTNVGASVRRFRKEFLQQYDPGEKSFEVAAQVQRPRADLRGRYRDVASSAKEVLGGLSGTVGAPEPRGGAPQGPGVPEGSQGLLALATALQAKPAPIQSAGLQLPAAAAGPRLPQGYQPSQGGGGPQAKPDVGELLAQIQTLGGDVEGAAGGAAAGTEIGSSGARASGGRVVMDPRADRAGAQTKRAVVDFAQEVSAIAGTPVRIGTGTRHQRMTTTGNVSDHWSGDAGDVPATGKRLIRLGQAALIAAGMPEAQARKETGGLYNVGGAQIIFNVKGAKNGGDHTNHLHFRPPRRRR